MVHSNAVFMVRAEMRHFSFDLFLYLRSKVDAKNCDHYDTDKDAAYAVSVEWNTQQGDGQNE